MSTLPKFSGGKSGAFIGVSAEDVVKMMNSFPKFIFVTNQRIDKGFRFL